MNASGSQYLPFATPMDYRDVRSKASLGVLPAEFPHVYKRPSMPQRNLRRKRVVEDYEHYAAVAIDEDGQHIMLSSPSLKRHKRSILADAVIRVQEVLGEASGSRQGAYPHMAELSEQHKEYHPPSALTGSISRPFESKRRHLTHDAPKRQHDADPYPVKSEGGHGREGRGSRSAITRKEMQYPSKLQAIQVDQRERWLSWFLDGFTSIQQTACRTIAKEWIKVIHPKKQSTHPYNGKMPRSEGGSPDPERTRPPYWPGHVRHKEPDHIDKADRTSLLVHLLMNTPQEEIVPDKAKSDRSFNARDLLAALEKKQDEGVSAKWRIIEELINAREALENYEAGGSDGDAMLYVPDWGDILRPTGPRRKGLNDPQVGSPDKSQLDSVITNERSLGGDDIDDQISDGDNPEQTLHQVAYNYTPTGTTAHQHMPINSHNGHVEQRLPNSSTQAPPHASFRVGGPPPRKLVPQQDKRRHESTRQTEPPSTWFHHPQLAAGLPSFEQVCWQTTPSRAEHVAEGDGLSSVTPYSGAPTQTRDTHFVATHSSNHAQLAHNMTNEVAYGGGGTYPFSNNQPAHNNYGMTPLASYQGLGYESQYGMDGTFFGVWDTNPGKEHDVQTLSH